MVIKIWFVVAQMIYMLKLVYSIVVLTGIHTGSVLDKIIIFEFVGVKMKKIFHVNLRSFM